MAVRGGQADGIDMHQGDIQPAFIKIVQGTSAEGTAGKIMRSDTSEEYDELNLIPIRIQKNRTFWGPGEFSRDRAPACFSQDGETGALLNNDGDPTLYPGQPCVTCPEYTESPWRDRDNCQPGYMVLFFNVDTYEVMGMRLTGTSAKMARKFSAATVFRKTVMKISTERKSNDHGTWYALVADAGRVVGDDEAEVMMAEAAMHSGGQAVSEDTVGHTPATVVDNSEADKALADMDEERYLANQAQAKALLDQEELAKQVSMSIPTDKHETPEGHPEPEYEKKPAPKRRGRPAAKKTDETPW